MCIEQSLSTTSVRNFSWEELQLGGTTAGRNYSLEELQLGGTTAGRNFKRLHLDGHHSQSAILQVI